MRARDRFVLLLLVFASTRVSSQAIPGDSARVAPPTITHRLRTIYGSMYLGRLVEVGVPVDSVRFETEGGPITLPKAAVREIISVAPREIHDGEYWFPNPNSTRLFFAPTGRMLPRRTSYYSNTYLWINGVYTGVTDNFSIGGSMTLLPWTGAQVGYVTPKLGVYSSENLNVGVGGLLGYNGFGTNNRERSFGILYSVATIGSADLSATGGIGWGYQGSGLSKQPAIMVGGAARISRGVALVTENYYVRTIASNSALLGYGFRFFGEKLSVDLAFFNAASAPVFPGIPFVSFSKNF
jgi:hypothetical protein